MKIYKIKIGERAELTAYVRHPDVDCVGSQKRKAMIVLPGGGYVALSEQESEPVALAYSAHGFQTFVLKYSIGENGVFPIPEVEVLKAVSIVRSHAEEWFLDPDKICLVGFSAGGHLAASATVHHVDPRVLKSCSLTEDEAKINGLVLVYPCITAGEHAYPGIREVHGRGFSESNMKYLSTENFVGAHVPPTYICHTSDDGCVPVMNSLLFAESLAKAQIPFELKITERGNHGMGLGIDSTFNVAYQDVKDGDFKTYTKMRKNRANFSKWLDESVEFLTRNLDGEI